MHDPSPLLDRWFGAWRDDRPLKADDPSMRLWWGKDDAVDAELRATFEGAHLAAARREMDDWAQQPTAAVARILLLDQLPRNLYRGTAHMFATDALARAAAHALLADGYDDLAPIHRYFSLMPLMHSESLDDHAVAVDRFEALAEATAHLARAGAYRGALDYEHRHRDIVARFGRYPHRNRALGRVSTPEEQAFLEQPGSSF